MSANRRIGHAHGRHRVASLDRLRSAATDDSPSEPLQLTLSPTRQYRALIVTLLKTRRAVLAPRISLVRRSDQSILGVWTVNQFLNRGGVLTARIALPSPSTDALSLVIDTDDAGLSDPKIYHVSSPFASPEYFFAKDLALNIKFARAGRVQIRGI